MKIVGPPVCGWRVRRQAADVPAVAHRQQRQHRDLRVLGRVQRAEQRARPGSRASTIVGPSSYQRACVVNAVCRQVERLEVDHLVVGQPLALVGEHLLGDVTRPKLSVTPQRLAPVEQPLDLGVGLALGLRVPVAVERLDERAARRPGRARAPRSAAQVQVDRAVVDRRERARRLDRAEQLAAGDVDQRERVRASAERSDTRAAG